MDNIFRKATTKDLAALMDIFGEAQSYLAQQGLDQWQDGYPSRSLIANDIAQGQSYVLEQAGDIVGTSVLQWGTEADYETIHEGAWHVGEPYACIHRMAMAPVKRGSGLAACLLAELEDLCVAQNVFGIRVDTHPGNLPMQKFLLKSGFSYCGVIHLVHNGAKRVAYDKSLHHDAAQQEITR